MRTTPAEGFGKLELGECFVCLFELEERSYPVPKAMGIH